MANMWVGCAVSSVQCISKNGTNTRAIYTLHFQQDPSNEQTSNNRIKSNNRILYYINTYNLRAFMQLCGQPFSILAIHKSIAHFSKSDLAKNSLFRT